MEHAVASSQSALGTVGEDGQVVSRSRCLAESHGSRDRHISSERVFP